MFQPKRTKPDERIPFALTKRERDLLLNLTLLDSDIEQRLRVAATAGTKLIVGLTLDDVDELAGSVAADANHSEEAKTRRALDGIYERLAKMEREYTDQEPATSLTGTTNVQATRPFTAKQGQYLAFIYYYTKIRGVAPAEADFRKHFRVTSPVVHQMILTLESQGFIERTPGQARSIRLRLSRAELPDLE
jgi:repressor LexA